ncbi:hypothetical protein AcdelDRAFT_0016 [Acidovorax delafieldii 2AN]|uniref:DNA-binding protein n=2 Tax=Acidovorax delafieldii TaxID=47920 RepID=C5SZD6_ACIDE|nr:hypothetical protein AcdelDRAFT_0016 [Acidovorax delafieldii 2AN]
MTGFITRETAAYQLNVPMHQLDAMIEAGEIGSTKQGGEVLLDQFEISRRSGFTQANQELSHTLECIAKCEEGPL